MSKLLLFLVPCAVVVRGQQPGHLRTESSPSMTIRECTKAGGCVAKQAPITLDANWRWIHEAGGHANCFKGATWNQQLCPDGETCAQKCALEGVTENQYSSTYGISGVAGGVKLDFLTGHNYGKNIGSRVYLMDGDDYHMFHLKNREFAIDVDSSRLECGLNGAVYFIEMDPSGGKGRGQNTAGAKFGTGYCDAQCPHDMKFIDGKANIKEWEPNSKDPSGNLGLGHYGACCAEMDIWEANKMATAFTPHPCALDGQLRCEGKSCGDNLKNERYQGVCDKDGCDINTYRMGNHTFYGPGPNFAVDSSRPITVVTQFITNDGTDQGDLVEIRRFYVQDGKKIHSPPSTILGSNGSSTITDGFCAKTKSLFGDIDDFKGKGGMAQMGRSLDRGHVLALSLWDDVEANMLWLDAAYPQTKPRNQSGVLRGPCPGGKSSTPSYIRDKFPNAYVTYANVAIGEIGSTTQDLGGNHGGGGKHGGGSKHPTPTPTPTPTPAPTPAPTLAPAPTPTPTPTHGGCAPIHGQCGGKHWTGPKCCEVGCRCTSRGAYYHQCVSKDGHYTCNGGGHRRLSANASLVLV